MGDVVSHPHPFGKIKKILGLSQGSAMPVSITRNSDARPVIVTDAGSFWTIKFTHGTPPISHEDDTDFSDRSSGFFITVGDGWCAEHAPEALAYILKRKLEGWMS